MNRLSLLFCTGIMLTGSALAQMRPPAFVGGIPGAAHFQAVQMQRHQARTLLYQEALEELRKNPVAADVPLCPPGASQQGALCLKRPESVAVVTDSASSVPQTEHRRLAVLIGNNDYKAPIPELETPIADVEKIAESLRQNFGYETRVVKNASKAKIIETLNAVATEAKATDSVLLFYAGHGYLMDDINMGFWIPVDGSVKSPNNWISNKDISKLLAAIPARQLILVSDSCFSGSLTNEQKVNYQEVPNVQEILKKRSVLAFSSGGDEPVSDEGREGHSIFAWSLIKTLGATNGTTPGQEVWRSVRKEIPKEFEQSPQYGAVVSAGHTEGGEFLFQAR